METSALIAVVMHYANGNPGALTFMMEIISGGTDKDYISSIQIMQKIKKCSSIRGTNLYILYSDLGDKDLRTIADICIKVPDEVLEDACNRQDYSGIELIKPYMI
jgi:hypothetical protein